MAGAVGAALALVSPAFARGGGHGGGMGGGHFGGGIGGGHIGGMHGGMGGAAHFSGGHFAGARFAHAGFAPGFSRAAFHHHGFVHHRHHRFVFVGAPYAYAYNNCWRRVWTAYGVRWVDVCGNYYGY
jgi:hypothetical protein